MTNNELTSEAGSKTQALIKKYQTHLSTVERKARLTVETYMYEAEIFAAWCGERGLSFDTIMTRDVVEYIINRRGAEGAKNGVGVSARSTGKALSIVRSLFNYICLTGIRDDNPAALLERPKTPKRIPQTLSAYEVDEILDATKPSEPSANSAPLRLILSRRDHTIFELIYSSGLRISEARGMNIDDIYWKESLVRVTGKGSKERMVPFGERAAACLKEYLENERPALLGKGNPTRALFISRRGKRLSRKSIWRNYSRLASLFGLPTRVHNLRHSFATEMLRGGAGLRSVQALLGHADLTTTQIYTHVDTSDLRKAHNRYLGALNIDTSTSDTHKEGH